jgi:hypothetical protein
MLHIQLLPSCDFNKGFVCCVSRSAKRASPASLLALVVTGISAEVSVADGAMLNIYNYYWEDRVKR